MPRLLSKVHVLVLMILSLVSTIAIGQTTSVQTRTTTSVTHIKTATRSVQVHVAKPAKPKVFVGNPHQAFRLAFNIDDDDNDVFDLDDIATAYRRRDLNTVKTDATDDNPEGLSEDIQWRLFLARQLALLKYREVNSRS